MKKSGAAEVFQNFRYHRVCVCVCVVRYCCLDGVSVSSFASPGAKERGERRREFPALQVVPYGLATSSVCTLLLLFLHFYDVRRLLYVHIAVVLPDLYLYLCVQAYCRDEALDSAINRPAIIEKGTVCLFKTAKACGTLFGHF